MLYIFFGHRGWIAASFLPLLNRAGHTVVLPQKYADNTEYVERLITVHNPDGIICFAGRQQNNNTEVNLNQNVRDNLFTPVLLSLLCNKHNVHLTYLNTGDIYNTNSNIESKIYSEFDIPNTETNDSVLCVKAHTDLLMKEFADSVLNVRIRLPITKRRHYKDFIRKLINSRNNINSKSNSITVLPTMFPILLDMVERKLTGTFNLVNPGEITHNEILELYTNICDTSFTWDNIDSDNCSESCILDTSSLLDMYPDIPHIKDDIESILRN